ncbi:unnamed protein product [Danaus chrysippus]|uniref:(African queen) hypothetical protein n=2 Tax=Danaus chrysippus TaxID=151541 RepID=A0A8J2QRP5_9NEOP|nr:unnamed protein product [Danaus chrysippus]
MTCFICKKDGHVASKCPENINDTKVLNQKTLNTTETPIFKRPHPPTESSTTTDFMESETTKENNENSDEDSDDKSSQSSLDEAYKPKSGKKLKKTHNDLALIDWDLVENFTSISGKTYPLSGKQVKEYLTHTYGIKDISEITYNYTEEILSLIEMFNDLIPIISHRSVKNRLSRIVGKLKLLSLSVEDYRELFSYFSQKTLILGDFNAHHTAWSYTTDTRGRLLSDTSINHNYVFLNNGHFTRCAKFNDSTICTSPDISFCSADLSLDFDWNITNESLGSDHLIISIKTLDSTQNSPELKRNIKQANWVEYTKHIESSCEGIDYGNDIQSNYDKFIRIIEESANKNIPYIKTSFNPNKFKPKPWWNPDLSKAVAERRLSLKNFRKLRTVENYLIYKEKVVIARKLIRLAKRNSWQRFCDSIDCNMASSEVWRKLRWLKGYRNPVNYLSESTAVSFVTELTPDSVSFQPLNSSIDNSNPLFFSFSELNLILKRVDTSAGLDSITYSMISHLPDNAKKYLLHIFNTIYRTGEIPYQWRRIKLIAIPKRDTEKVNTINESKAQLPIHDLKRLTEDMIDIQFSDYIKIYTDGSKTRDGSSCAFYDIATDFGAKFLIENSCIPIMGVELIAIKEAMHYIESTSYHKIVILTDSKSSLQHLLRSARGGCVGRNEAYLVIKCIYRLIRNGVEVRLQWIPSHVGVRGNEVADSLASKALRNGIPLDITPHYTDYFPKIKNENYLKFKSYFSECSQNRGLWYRSIVDEPPRIPWFASRNLNRKYLTICFRTRTYHIPLNKFNFTMKKRDDPNCKRCEREEDLLHLVLECKINEQSRLDFLNETRCSRGELLFSLHQILSSNFTAEHSGRFVSFIIDSLNRRSEYYKNAH